MFGRNKVVSVTTFFLMKNVLRHGREKKEERRAWFHASIKLDVEAYANNGPYM